MKPGYIEPSTGFDFAEVERSLGEPVTDDSDRESVCIALRRFMLWLVQPPKSGNFSVAVGSRVLIIAQNIAPDLLKGSPSLARLAEKLARAQSKPPRKQTCPAASDGERGS